MKIYRYMYLLLATVLLFAVVPVQAFAAEAPMVQVVGSKATPAMGEEVTFSVNLKNFVAPSNNLSSFEVKLDFDSSAWDTVTDKNELGEYIKSLKSGSYEMPVNTVGNGTVHFGLSIYKNENTAYFSGDGTLFTFKLKAKKNGLTDVSITKSLFVQISKPGVNVAHGKGNARIDIGGTTPPPPPPIDPGTVIAPPVQEVPIMPAMVERKQSATPDGKTQETISFNGENAKKTIEQAVKSKSKAVEIRVNGSGKEADTISFTMSGDTISQLVAQNLYLIINSVKGQMELTVDILKSLKSDVKVDLFLQSDSTKLEMTKKLITENVRHGQVAGQSTEIKTNFSGRTKVTLPLDSNGKDVSSLGVFIQHSDGTVEFVKGEIQKDKDGKPVTITLWVDRFSTFTIVSNLYVKQVYVDDFKISAYANESVYKAQELGLMSGVNSAPEFAPAQAMTRAQFTKIILEMLGEKPAASSKTSQFKDVTEDHWAFGYIAKAVELGIVKGATPDSFKPGAFITREQMALMLGRAYKLQAGSATGAAFHDEAKISTEALPFIKILQEKGVINGDKGFFRPKQNVTREMAAVIAVRMLESLK
ncbi:S-layer homology domain-containing protein [Pseudoneobacillus sp. C159]